MVKIYKLKTKYYNLKKQMGSGDVVDLGFRYLSYKERQRNREEAARRREEERKAAARRREIQATERIQR
jgi:hypothetical protein